MSNTWPTEQDVQDRVDLGAAQTRALALKNDNAELQRELDRHVTLLTEARKWLEDLHVRWSDHENWSYVRACMQRMDAVLKAPKPSQSDAAGVKND